MGGKLDVFPNKSSVKLFCDMETNEFSWKDPNELIGIEKKQEIASSVRQKGKAMSNSLFYCFSDWPSIPPGANPFVKELMGAICRHVDVDKKGEHNQTPLMLFCQFGAEKAVSKLIQREANTRAVDKNGRTALHFAAKIGSSSVCNVLLRNGANINAETRCRETAIMMAAVNGKEEVVKFLLQNYADTRITDIFGKSARQLATTNDCADIIRAHEAKNYSKCIIL